MFRLTNLLNSILDDDKVSTVRTKYDDFVKLLYVSSIHFAVRMAVQSDYTPIEHDRVTAPKIVLRVDEAGRPS